MIRIIHFIHLHLSISPLQQFHSSPNPPSQLASTQIGKQISTNGPPYKHLSQSLQALEQPGNCNIRALISKNAKKIYKYCLFIVKTNIFKSYLKPYHTYRFVSDLSTHFFNTVSVISTEARFVLSHSLHPSLLSPVLKKLKHTSGIPSSFKHFSLSSASYLKQHRSRIKK